LDRFDNDDFEMDWSDEMKTVLSVLAIVIPTAIISYVAVVIVGQFLARFL
jgi:hypothetical protein